MKPIARFATILSALAAAAWAQQAPFPAAAPTAPTPRPAAPAAVPVMPGRAMMGMPAAKWWDNPEISARLGLSEEQKKRMDDVFQSSRIKLIDLRASLEKEEAMLDPLMQAANPDDSKLLPQIDRVAQARAELEKADARLLLGLRHILSPQQWQNLQADRGQLRPTAAPVRPARGFGQGQGMGQGNPPLPPPPGAYPPEQNHGTTPPPPTLPGRGGEGSQP